MKKLSMLAIVTVTAVTVTEVLCISASRMQLHNLTLGTWPRMWTPARPTSPAPSPGR